jgi:hypothetical protein
MAKASKKTSTKSPKSSDDDEIEAVAVEDESSDDEVAEVTPDDDEELDKGEPVPPTGSPTKPTNITVAGTGTLSIMADGKANSVERGKKFKASPELLEALTAHGETIEEA